MVRQIIDGVPPEELDELPDSLTREPTGAFNERYLGTEHGCPECGSSFGEFYSANYCPVCKEHIRGRTGEGGGTLARYADQEGSP